MARVPPTPATPKLPGPAGAVPVALPLIALDGIGVEVHEADDGRKRLVLGPLMLAVTLGADDAKLVAGALADTSSSSTLEAIVTPSLILPR